MKFYLGIDLDVYNVLLELGHDRTYGYDYCSFTCKYSESCGCAHGSFWYTIWRDCWDIKKLNSQKAWFQWIKKQTIMSFLGWPLKHSFRFYFTPGWCSNHSDTTHGTLHPIYDPCKNIIDKILAEIKVGLHWFSKMGPQGIQSHTCKYFQSTQNHCKA